MFLQGWGGEGCDYIIIALSLTSLDSCCALLIFSHLAWCIFWPYFKACTCHGVDADETCLDCLRSKVNIER